MAGGYIMVQRNEYLEQLKKWKDDQVIKVVTGIRRCGKSTLLKLFQDYLKSQGVEDNQIISINFEELEYEELLDYKNFTPSSKKDCTKPKPHTFFLTKYNKSKTFKKQ